MTDHSTLAEALSAFQAEAPNVHRSKTAKIPGRDGGPGYSYTYADLADVAKAAYPVLSKHGLSFTCQPRHLDGVGQVLAGVLMHSSGERLEGTLPISGRDPQSLGSAITYMRRYLFGCMTGIVTDDDDDSGAAMATPAPPRTVVDPAALYTEAVHAATAEDTAKLKTVLGTIKAMDLEHFAIPGGPYAGKRLGDVVAQMLAEAPGGVEPEVCPIKDCVEWAGHQGDHVNQNGEPIYCSGKRRDDGMLCSKTIGHTGQHQYDRNPE